jgi:hypothetical protein
MQKVYSFILFIFIIWISGSCDKVKESSAPDLFSQFSTSDIKSLTTTVNTPVTFTLFDSLMVREGVTFAFRQPVFGSAKAAPVFGRFEYSPPVNFAGKDSMEYELCKNGTCKKGQVLFIVELPSTACIIQLADDVFDIHNESNFTLNVLQNDLLLCQNVTLIEVTHEADILASVGAGVIAIKVGAFYNRSTLLQYKVRDAEGKEYTAQVQLKLSYDAAFCNAYFAPQPDELILFKGFYFITFKPEVLLRNDVSCKNDINAASFTIQTPPNSGKGTLSLRGNEYWYIVTDTAGFSQDSFEYRVSTQSGNSAATTVTIKKVW